MYCDYNCFRIVINLCICKCKCYKCGNKKINLFLSLEVLGNFGQNLKNLKNISYFKKTQKRLYKKISRAKY